MLKRSAGGIATRRARPIRFVDNPRPLASFHYTLTFHSCAAPHALGPARTPSSRRAAPVPSRRESTGVDRNRVARRSRSDPHKSRRSRLLCVRRSRLRENSSWVQQEKTAPSAGSNELADYLTTKRIEFSYSTGNSGWFCSGEVAMKEMVKTDLVTRARRVRRRLKSRLPIREAPLFCYNWGYP